MASKVVPWGSVKFSGTRLDFYGRLKHKKNDREKAASLWIRHILLKIKTIYSVTLGMGTAEAEPITTVAEKGVMQDMKKTGSGMVKAGSGTMETGLIWEMLNQGWRQLDQMRQKPNL